MLFPNHGVACVYCFFIDIFWLLKFELLLEQTDLDDYESFTELFEKANLVVSVSLKVKNILTLPILKYPVNLFAKYLFN